MKTTTTIIFLFFFALNCSYAQYEIDVSSILKQKEIPVDVGTYEFKLIGADITKEYQIKIEREDMKIEKLESLSSVDSISSFKEISLPIGEFQIGYGQILTITITTFTKGTPPVKEGEPFIYIYKTDKRGEWRTTFGFNFVGLLSNSAYFSSDNGDETFTITEGTNKKKIEYYPSLMFTWLSRKSLDKDNNWKHAWSAGLGYDLDKSLSVFFGKSLIYNENITLTAGVAIHNQKRLSSNYQENDIINENLNFDQLHSDYIRFNPFVSLSLRLDKNPFSN